MTVVRKMLYLCIDDNLLAVANLEMMLRRGVRPETIVVLCRSKLKAYLRLLLGDAIRLIRLLTKRPVSDISDRHRSEAFFGRDINESTVLRVLRRERIPRIVLTASSVNDRVVLETIGRTSAGLIFFNAPGILGTSALTLGKKWVNCHKGLLPHVRGSSATFWSLLMGIELGVTIHYVTSGIDQGSILFARKFEPRKCATFRQWLLYEAYMISSSLLAFIETKCLHLDRLVPIGEEQNPCLGQTYYRLHIDLSRLSLKHIVKDLSEFDILNSFRSRLRRWLPDESANPSSGGGLINGDPACLIRELKEQKSEKINDLVESLRNLPDRGDSSPLGGPVQDMLASLNLLSVDKLIAISKKNDGALRVRELVLAHCLFVGHLGKNSTLVFLNTTMKSLDIFYEARLFIHYGGVLMNLLEESAEVLEKYLARHFALS